MAIPYELYQSLQGRLNFLFPLSPSLSVSACVIVTHACSLSVALPFLNLQPQFKGHGFPFSFSFFASDESHTFVKTAVQTAR